ncbi:MAG: prepilin-type N-terminal cleavage/methylation domain-containing protein [bacterium]
MGKTGTCQRGERNRSRQGMTLVEVVIASVVLMIITAGFISAIVTGTRLNYSSAQHVAAFGLCKGRFEQMREMHMDLFTNITEAAFPFEPSLPLTHTSGKTQLPLRCTRSTTIRDFDDPIRKEVTIVVAWTFAGKPTQERLDTVIYKKK